jgi:hypothetical protein
MSRAASRAGKSSPSSRVKSSAGKSASAPLISNSYLQQSQLPLHCLVFLLPLMAIYEFFSPFFNQHIYAAKMMADFFRMLGATGRMMPALAVVSILLAWHIARKDKWAIQMNILWGMLAESVILAVPLILIGLILIRYIPLQRCAAGLGTSYILSMGAGIYEELVFRLIGFTLLTIIFVDLMKMVPWKANLLMVVICAILFSAYHYLGSEPFQWRSFIFRAVAGVYFGGIFWGRGFGVTAGCHSAYDIFIFSLQKVG